MFSIVLLLYMMQYRFQLYTECLCDFNDNRSGHSWFIQGFEDALLFDQMLGKNGNNIGE